MILSRLIRILRADHLSLLAVPSVTWIFVALRRWRRWVVHIAGGMWRNPSSGSSEALRHLARRSFSLVSWFKSWSSVSSMSRPTCYIIESVESQRRLALKGLPRGEDAAMFSAAPARSSSYEASYEPSSTSEVTADTSFCARFFSPYLIPFSWPRSWQFSWFVTMHVCWTTCLEDRLPGNGSH
ncbi:hypothetical protein CORC01_07810 [Colletotrichum orchidophilum]|uniref:Uncharacterized protein n=1 Tax=Colletotrichum orchidophilum TaxID=1209926 RepID=A0A1G4B6A5_9PEZI|nr:uncharacterized protein CORC01_07810 [Colletotrichum orchidophilum]OHE96843.1 hypothetical protein CORC01_07810 [Colletotrichum orchidophilum]